MTNSYVIFNNRSNNVRNVNKEGKRNANKSKIGTEWGTKPVINWLQMEININKDDKSLVWRIF